jgi:hypothetical protein
MTLAGDSILVTPGSGATVATHTVSAKEHQVVMVAAETGQLLGSLPIYWYAIAEQVHVAAASTIHFDMFNAHATLRVRVLSIRQRPSIVTAVTGAAFNWTFQRTTAVGTGGSAQTAILRDTATPQTALDAAITCRSKPTGGATPGVALRSYAVHSEETNVGVVALASQGGLELIPFGQLRDYQYAGIYLGQNQGLSVTQTTNSSAGNTGWDILFTVE